MYDRHQNQDSRVRGGWGCDRSGRQKDESGRVEGVSLPGMIFQGFCYRYCQLIKGTSAPKDLTYESMLTVHCLLLAPQNRRHRVGFHDLDT